MTRPQLVALLANLVANKHLGAIEAKSVLNAFDAGLLPDLSELMAVQDDGGDNAWLAAVVAIATMLGGRLGVPLNEAQRQRGKTLLRNRYERENNVLAIQVTQRGMAVAVWQANLYTIIASYARQMAVAGAGGLPSPSVRLDTNAQIAAQVPFLRRFSFQMTAQRLLGRPMTTLGVSSRANLYGGVGWASWFKGHGQDAAWGYVERWVARDDKFVCPRCAARSGRYYLPLQGPMPGQDCYGSCHCQRVQEYNPEMYAQLTGRRAAA